MRGTRWTETEIKAIRDTRLSAKDLTEIVDRTEKAIKEKRYYMGISAKTDQMYIPPQITMTSQEKEYRIYKLAAKIGVRIP